jgi:RNA polymerase sigma-70 factor (ECF subfamily)
MPEHVANSSFDSTFSSLLYHVRDNDSDAWSKLSKLYAPLVYRWARTGGLQDQDAADITQEVFQAVAKSIQAFDPSQGGSFRAWLWGITRNKMADHFRQQANRAQAAGGTDAHQALQNIPEFPVDAPRDGFDVDASLFHRALELLKTDFQPTTWQAFWRMAVDGQRAADVAEELGMTKKAVRQAKYRVLQRLRAELDDAIQDGDGEARG